MTSLALLLEAQGNLAEAEPLFRQVLEGREASLGASNLQTLSSAPWRRGPGAVAER